MSLKDASTALVGYLGPGATLSGGLEFRDTLRLDCSVRDGFLRGGVLVVGPDATVEGTVDVDVLSVEGEVHGEIVVRRQLEIHAGGRVGGTIRLMGPCMTLEEGGAVDGSVDIVEPAADGHLDERNAASAG